MTIYANYSCFQCLRRTGDIPLVNNTPDERYWTDCGYRRYVLKANTPSEEDSTIYLCPRCRLKQELILQDILLNKDMLIMLMNEMDKLRNVYQEE